VFTLIEFPHRVQRYCWTNRTQNLSPMTPFLCQSSVREMKTKNVASLVGPVAKTAAFPRLTVRMTKFWMSLLLLLFEMLLMTSEGDIRRI